MACKVRHTERSAFTLVTERQICLRHANRAHARRGHASLYFRVPGKGVAAHAAVRACAGVLGGVLVYTFHDIHFTVLGYVWIAVWYAFAVFEMVYVKIVVDSVQMTTWSRTYYQARAPLPRSRQFSQTSQAAGLGRWTCCASGAWTPIEVRTKAHIHAT